MITASTPRAFSLNDSVRVAPSAASAASAASLTAAPARGRPASPSAVGEAVAGVMSASPVVSCVVLQVVSSFPDTKLYASRCFIQGFSSSWGRLARCIGVLKK